MGNSNKSPNHSLAKSNTSLHHTFTFNKKLSNVQSSQQKHHIYNQLNAATNFGIHFRQISAFYQFNIEFNNINNLNEMKAIKKVCFKQEIVPLVNEKISRIEKIVDSQDNSLKDKFKSLLSYAEGTTYNNIEVNDFRIDMNITQSRIVYNRYHKNFNEIEIKRLPNQQNQLKKGIEIIKRMIASPIKKYLIYS